MGDGEHTIFGQLGVVSHDTEGRMQCHLCGKFYIHIGSHLKAHRITPDEYRATFELNRQQPLASHEYCQSRKPIALKNQLEGKFPSGGVGRFLLREARQKESNRYVRRLQERLTRSALLKVNNPSFSVIVKRKISEAQKRAWCRRRGHRKGVDDNV